MLVVLLLGIIALRDPRFAQTDELFLRWLLDHAPGGTGKAVPLTVVEIGGDSLMDPKAAAAEATAIRQQGGSGAAISPLEFALFLQSLLDFQPSVVAFENILKWRDRDKDQEQVFLDQAMRVPKLLLASELNANPDPDAPWGDIRGFAQVSGKRGDLPEFSGIGRQPAEDLRLISTPGFSNLSEDTGRGQRVPLLFLYRGEVVPSFTLQAILLWLRVPLTEVKIRLGSEILLPHDRRIPVAADGTLLVNPTALRRAGRLSLNELLLAAQQRDTANAGGAQATLDLRSHIVLARTPANPLSPPDLFAAAMATIQGNRYLRRISPVFDCVILLLITATAGMMRKVPRLDLVLCGIAFTAAYCLVALAAVSRWNTWLPGVLPLGAIWFAIFARSAFAKATPRVIRPWRIPPPHRLTGARRVKFTNLTRRIEIGANCYGLESGGQRLIIDCGMHPKQEGEEALPNFQAFGSGAIEAILISHAHQDHIGTLPVLMRRNPDARVFMTEATATIGDTMLHNSVNVMTRQREESGTTMYPLFTHQETNRATELWRSCRFRQPISLTGERMRRPEGNGLTFEFLDAGHVLGSAGILLRAEGRTFFYSGDVNFDDQTLAQGAAFPETGIDVLIIETTRGDSPLPEGFTRAAEERRLAEAIARAFERGGCVLIPVFALGKTQEALAMIHRFRREKLLGEFPVYIGGLSTKLTEIYDRFALTSRRNFPRLQLLEAIEPFVLNGQTIADAPAKPGRIYLLSSGMMTPKTLSNIFARRVLEDPKHSIFFVGYADPVSPAGILRAAQPGDLGVAGSGRTAPAFALQHRDVSV